MMLCNTFQTCMAARIVPLTHSLPGHYVQGKIIHKVSNSILHASKNQCILHYALLHNTHLFVYPANSTTIIQPHHVKTIQVHSLNITAL